MRSTEPKLKNSETNELTRIMHRFLLRSATKLGDCSLISSLDGELIGVVGKQGFHIQGVQIVGHLLAHIGKSFSYRGGSKRVSGHAEAGLVGPFDQGGLAHNRFLSGPIPANPSTL